MEREKNKQGNLERAIPPKINGFTTTTTNPGQLITMEQSEVGHDSLLCAPNEIIKGRSDG